MISASTKAASGAAPAGLRIVVQPARQRGRQLRGELVQRVVPRRDGGDDAGGLPDQQRRADPALERKVRERCRRSSGTRPPPGRPAPAARWRSACPTSRLISSASCSLRASRPSAMARRTATRSGHRASRPRPGTRPGRPRPPARPRAPPPRGTLPMTSSVRLSITVDVAARIAARSSGRRCRALCGPPRQPPSVPAETVKLPETPSVTTVWDLRPWLGQYLQDEF